MWLCEKRVFRIDRGSIKFADFELEESYRVMCLSLAWAITKSAVAADDGVMGKGSILRKESLLKAEKGGGWYCEHRHGRCVGGRNLVFGSRRSVIFETVATVASSFV